QVATGTLCFGSCARRLSGTTIIINMSRMANLIGMGIALHAMSIARRVRNTHSVPDGRSFLADERLIGTPYRKLSDTLTSDISPSRRPWAKHLAQYASHDRFRSRPYRCHPDPHSGFLGRTLAWTTELLD